MNRILWATLYISGVFFFFSTMSTISIYFRVLYPLFSASHVHYLTARNIYSSVIVLGLLYSPRKETGKKKILKGCIVVV